MSYFCVHVDNTATMIKTTACMLAKKKRIKKTSAAKARYQCEAQYLALTLSTPLF
jgi:hypothetical protein